MYDVLIVGAGAAGLAAGRLIAQAGRRVAILEARDRIGGRIFTHHLDGADGPIPIELGAEFIHGLPAASWSIVEEARLAAYEIGGSQVRLEGGRAASTDDPLIEPHTLLETMAGWLEKQPPGLDMTFADYLASIGADPASGEAAANYVEGFNAADRTRIGIASLAKQQRAEDAIDADRLFRLSAGYDALPAYLAAEFVSAGGVLELSAPVRTIEWQRGHASLSVRGPDGVLRQFAAKRVLITIPLGVLQSESIGFKPSVDETMKQARRLIMGPAARVTLVFRSRFWADLPEPGLKHLGFLFAPGGLPPTWWTSSPELSPVITGWTGGPKAIALERLSSSSGEGLIEQCVSTLSGALGVSRSRLEGDLLSAHHHDWLSDEYACGAYSYVPAGALDAPERISCPIENTLYFAGEHTDLSGHWGTVHAALDSGVRAAGRLLAEG